MEDGVKVGSVLWARRVGGIRVVLRKHRVDVERVEEARADGAGDGGEEALPVELDEKVRGRHLNREEHAADGGAESG